MAKQGHRKGASKKSKINWSEFKTKKGILKLSAAIILSIFTIILILFGLVRIGLFGKIPGREELKKIQHHLASEVISEDNQILGKYFIENRTDIKYNDISIYVLEALVSVEDERFYKHKGIDFKSLGRVAIKSLLLHNESAGGGSTLTQQLAKNIYPRKDIPFIGMIVNKFREIIIASKLESVYNKEEILALYLNTVPFGGSNYGIKSISEHLFSKPPKKLKIEEAALLTGMLKATTYYNPRQFPDRAKLRRDVVLKQMVRNNHLSEHEADSLIKIPIKLNITPLSHNEGLATYFREYLRLQLENYFDNNPKEDGTVWNIYTDGLRIYTTIHAGMQAYAETAMQTQMKKIQANFDQQWQDRNPWGNDQSLVNNAVYNSERYISLKKAGKSAEEIDLDFNTKIHMKLFTYSGFKSVEMSPRDSVMYYLKLLQAGFMAMESKSGYIRTWVGGVSHQFFKYDHVTSKRQAGSTFKPLVYAAALEKGLSPCEYFANDSIVYGEYDNWTPQNADGKFGGEYSLQGALINSVNTVSVQVLLKTGFKAVINLAHDAGISAKLPEVPSLALGIADVSIFEMVKAYSMFVNDGKIVEPVYLKRIEDKEGNVIVEFSKSISEEPIISEETANTMRLILQNIVNRGTGAALKSRFGIPGEIGGKTGTTQSNADGWFVGFTPTMVAGAWVGGSYPQIRFRNSQGQGAATALPIWGSFFYQLYRDPLYKNLASTYFPTKDYLSAQLNCPDYKIDSTSTDTFFERLFKSRDDKKFEKEEKENRILNRIKEIFGGKGRRR